MWLDGHPTSSARARLTLPRPQLWITNVAILLGAEVNAERERTRQLKDGTPEAERELQLAERSQPKAKKRSRTA